MHMKGLIAACRPVRILLVADGPIPHHYMNFRGDQIVRHLVQNGHELVVVCPRGPMQKERVRNGGFNPLYIYLPPQQGMISPLTLFRRVSLMLRMIMQVRILLGTESFDLIRAVSFLPAVASIIARGSRRIPLVTNLSDFYSDLYRQFGLPLSSFVSSFLKWMERYVASESDVLIVDSLDQRKQFVSLGSREERTVVIPHGIPAQERNSATHVGIVPDPQSLFSGVTTPKVVFYIGDVSKLDGVDVLIRSMKLLAGFGGQARLLIVGSGSS